MPYVGLFIVNILGELEEQCDSRRGFVYSAYCE